MLTKNPKVDQLPQKEPFRFIDDIVEFDGQSKKIVCSYVFPKSSFFYKGHFPGNPITPGVLLIESMAQSAILLFHELYGKTDQGPVYLNKVEEIVFRKPVEPDHKINIISELYRTVNQFCFVKSSIRFDDGSLVAKGSLIVTV